MAAQPTHVENRGGVRTHRLPAAFERLSSLPALAESRNRLLRVLLEQEESGGRLVRVIESDIALVVAVLRSANHVARKRREGRRARRGVASIPEAVALLTPEGVGVLARRIAVVDFFDRMPGWSTPPDHVRLHATATQELIAPLAEDEDPARRDELLVAALLHDVGKLVLMDAYASYPDRLLAGARTPDERVVAERRQLGVDHAVVGGVLARRWGLPDRLAESIARHHDPGGNADAALIRVADMLAHYRQGRPVDRNLLIAAASEAGVDDERLRALMYEGAPAAAPAPRSVEPSPLSSQQRHVLRGLAEGKVYKEIAKDMGVSASTVRTHLHVAYRKLGVVDRAQAVLRASERGWI